MAIITAAEYKTHRGISGTDYDAILAVIIPSKQAWLERQCGRLFDEDTYTDQVHDGDGTQRLYLNNWPVSAVTAVKSVASDGSTTTLDSTAYRLVDSEYLYRLGSTETAWESPSPFSGYRGPCFTEGDGNYSVSYTAGYATAPDDLKAVMFTLIDMALEERGRNPVLAQSADGVVQRTRMSAMERRTILADLVRPWKRVTV